MPSFIYCEELDQVIPAEEFYLRKYTKTAHLRMTDGNEEVHMNFVSDTMPETRHMADGQYYTSKKAFRDATKRAGCVEIGNETKYLTKPRVPVKLDRRQRREDIGKAIHDLRNGKVPRN